MLTSPSKIVETLELEGVSPTLPFLAKCSYFLLGIPHFDRLHCLLARITVFSLRVFGNPRNTTDSRVEILVLDELDCGHC